MWKWFHRYNSRSTDNKSKNRQVRIYQAQFLNLAQTRELTKSYQPAIDGIRLKLIWCNTWNWTDDLPKLKLFPTPLFLQNANINIAAAGAKLLQSCPTLCNPIDGSPIGSPIPGILQTRALEWVPSPFPMHESEKWKWSRSVVSNSSWRHGIFQARAWEWGAIAFSLFCHSIKEKYW